MIRKSLFVVSTHLSKLHYSALDVLRPKSRLLRVTIALPNVSQMHGNITVFYMNALLVLSMKMEMRRKKYLGASIMLAVP